MKVYELELKLASGDVDTSNLPNDDLVFNIYKEMGSEEYVCVELFSMDDLKKLNDYANKGYFGCSECQCEHSVVVDFELNQVIIYDDYLE